MSSEAETLPTMGENYDDVPLNLESVTHSQSVEDIVGNIDHGSVGNGGSINNNNGNGGS